MRGISLLAAFTAISVIAGTSVIHAQSADLNMDALVKRTSPGLGQAQLKPLLGRWQVVKTNYLLGPGGKPVTSERMTTERVMIGDGRFVSDVTTGLLGGRPYFRTGLLGYNNIAKRYEWVTADNITPLLMSYQGRDGTEPGARVDMLGSFADPGVMGESNVGKSVAMRTEIRIIDADHHEIDLYFTPAGQPEKLVDKMVYTRIAARRHG